MRGRLNLFQASMLRWRALHPYTAVHVVRIGNALDAARLAAVIGETLGALGLTGFVLDARRLRFEYTGGPAQVALAVHAGGDAPAEVLRQTIERELNAPFARDGALDPFRFFAIDSGRWFRLGLVYDHVVSGGDSIVVLLERIVARYGGEADAPPGRPFDRHPPRYARLFLRHAWPALRGLPYLGTIAASCRRTVRPAVPASDDGSNGFTHRRLEPPQFEGLARAARAWGVTVNDALLAIVLRALEPCAGTRMQDARRHELAVASILNLRRDMRLDANATFGQFLSALRVSHPLPEGVPLEAIARDIHAETTRIKGGRLYLQSLLGVALSGAVWPFLSPQQRAGFYAKHYPTWGAITPLYVDPLWQQTGGHMPPPEYLRAVSTGPLAPLVVAITVAGGALHAGLSYRRAVLSAQAAGQVADAIVERCLHPDA